MTDRANPLVRRAIALGYEIHPGRRHWHARHTVTGAFAIIPRGRTMPTHSYRNVVAALKRGARAAVTLEANAS